MQKGEIECKKIETENRNLKSVPLQSLPIGPCIVLKITLIS